MARISASTIKRSVTPDGYSVAAPSSSFTIEVSVSRLADALAGGEVASSGAGIEDSSTACFSLLGSLVVAILVMWLGAAQSW